MKQATTLFSTPALRVLFLVPVLCRDTYLKTDYFLAQKQENEPRSTNCVDEYAKCRVSKRYMQFQ
jgi:hypothetical protein